LTARSTRLPVLPPASISRLANSSPRAARFIQHCNTGFCAPQMAVVLLSHFAAMSGLPRPLRHPWRAASETCAQQIAGLTPQVRNAVSDGFACPEYSMGFRSSGPLACTAVRRRFFQRLLRGFRTGVGWSGLPPPSRPKPLSRHPASLRRHLMFGPVSLHVRCRDQLGRRYPAPA